MKIVLPGGSGHVGQLLREHFTKRGDEVTVISRSHGVRWDGKTLGDWATTLEGADVVINLAGRSVNCRYNRANMDEIMSSRLDSTKVLGEAIRACANPPKVWIQSSTATIYSHRFDAPNDDETGILGDASDPMPPKWLASVDVAKAWEKAFAEADTPATRKVAIRSAIVMATTPGSAFTVLAGLARRGILGTQGNGKQFVSWIHETDFCQAIDWLIEHEIVGPVNIASPNPLPQRDFAKVLRDALGVRMALPTPSWLLEIGAFFMGTETELILKSRRVVPSLLLSQGFKFEFPTWDSATADLVRRLNP